MGLMLALNLPVPDQTSVVCKDGWDSPSVGHQGACSHHGGVAWMTPHDIALAHNKWMTLWAALGGLLVWGFIENQIEKRFPLVLAPNEIIEQAIKHQREIRFQYKKRSNVALEARHIKPMKIVSMGGRNASVQICVQGYCYTRRAQRTFAIERMTDIETVE
jgi:hypothetical protein